MTFFFYYSSLNFYANHLVVSSFNPSDPPLISLFLSFKTHTHTHTHRHTHTHTSQIPCFYPILGPLGPNPSPHGRVFCELSQEIWVDIFDITLTFNVTFDKTLPLWTFTFPICKQNEYWNWWSPIPATLAEKLKFSHLCLYQIFASELLHPSDTRGGFLKTFPIYPDLSKGRGPLNGNPCSWLHFLI